MGNSRVQKFHRNGTFILTWGSYGTGNGQFSDSIPGITVDSKGFVYVIDRLESRIQKFDGMGTLIAKWGAKGSSLGDLNKPEDIAINNKTGEVFITDTQNSRVQVFQIK
jgi:DNA-binding beta-propeller fold protein YncE